MATGLQHVGISMTCTLLGELIVLGTGSAIKTTHVRSFCIFASLALVVAYLLNLTFFMAVLSIDIKRGEVKRFLTLINLVFLLNLVISY